MDLTKVSKKLSLFSILLFLLIIITCNLLLTVWIVLSLRINLTGERRQVVRFLMLSDFKDLATSAL